MGFYHIARAVSFLNNDCGLVSCCLAALCWPPKLSPALTDSRRAQVHGNVCMQAVVVTPTLDWRLHGLDLLSEHAAAGDASDGWALAASSWMVASQYKPAEVGRSDWQVRLVPVVSRGDCTLICCSFWLSSAAADQSFGLHVCTRGGLQQGMQCRRQPLQ